MPAYIELAKQFGDLIAKEDYTSAHALLTKNSQKLHSPDDFKDAVIGMTRYAPGPIRNVVVMEDLVLEDWPAKQDADVVSVYVALEGDNYSEAVYLTIAHEGSDFRIRDLEWGRP